MPGLPGGLRIRGGVLPHTAGRPSTTLQLAPGSYHVVSSEPADPAVERSADTVDVEPGFSYTNCRYASAPNSSTRSRRLPADGSGSDRGVPTPSVNSVLARRNPFPVELLDAAGPIRGDHPTERESFALSNQLDT